LDTPAPTEREVGRQLPPLDGGRLHDATVPLVRRVEVVAETGSTNADLVERARAGENVGGVLRIAEHQSAGRGRSGRAWSSVAGAQITMSLGFAPEGLPSAAWGWIPLVTGLAVVDAVAATGAIVGLKWPNDVLARPPRAGKLAGILAEVGSPSAIIVGIGLNVALRGDELPDPAATSLWLLGARVKERESLIIAVLDGLAGRLSQLARHSGADRTLIAEYERASLTIGSQVRAILPGEQEVVGVASSVDELGRLNIDTSAGIRAISAGDIIHLRLAAGTEGR